MRHLCSVKCERRNITGKLACCLLKPRVVSVSCGKDGRGGLEIVYLTMLFLSFFFLGEAGRDEEKVPQSHANASLHNRTASEVVGGEKCLLEGVAVTVGKVGFDSLASVASK